MESRINEVLDCFSSGFYCSQAILSTYCEDFGLDKKTACKISCGLAAGMARLSQTCGAVSGAYLVISLKHGNFSPNDTEALEKTFELIQEFNRQFVNKHNSINCRELLGVDLITGDKGTAKQQVQKLCPLLVKDAAEILEDILNKP